MEHPYEDTLKARLDLGLQKMAQPQGDSDEAIEKEWEQWLASAPFPLLVLERLIQETQKQPCIPEYRNRKFPGLMAAQNLYQKRKQKLNALVLKCSCDDLRELDSCEKEQLLKEALQQKHFLRAQQVLEVLVPPFFNPGDLLEKAVLSLIDQPPEKTAFLRKPSFNVIFDALTPEDWEEHANKIMGRILGADRKDLWSVLAEQGGETMAQFLNREQWNNSIWQNWVLTHFKLSGTKEREFATDWLLEHIADPVSVGKRILEEEHGPFLTYPWEAVDYTFSRMPVEAIETLLEDKPDLHQHLPRTSQKKEAHERVQLAEQNKKARGARRSRHA